MRRTKKAWLIDNVAVPFFAGIYFAVTGIYKLAFSWWLDPWLQRRASQRLLSEVEANLYFLTSEAEEVNVPRTVRPFDFVSVEILWRNLFIVITRGRGEVGVYLAPRRARNEQSELGPTIAALDGRLLSERDVVSDLADAAALLRPRLDHLNAAFSAEQFERTSKII